MGLKKVKEDLESQLEEALKREETEPVLDEDDSMPEVEAEEEKPAEPEPEPAKPEPKPEEDKGPARLRIEAAAARKEAEELKAENARLKAEREEPEAQESPLPPALQEIVEDHTRGKAWNEVQTFEAQARANNPDYDAISGQYTATIAQSYKNLNPDYSDHQIIEMTKQRVLDEISNLYKAGYKNPTEEMYFRLKERGYKTLEAKIEPVAEEEIRPDMAKVAANRARNAGTVAASGEAAQTLTRQAAATLSPAQWKALPRSQREKLLRDA